MANSSFTFDDEEHLPWRVWRYLILKRSNFRCDECGVTERELKAGRGATGHDLHAHHVNHNDRDHRLANGLTLCPPCHSRLHRAGGQVLNSAQAWETRRARYGPGGQSPVAAVARHARRKTHCKRGHPFDEENTIIRPDGSRVCRTCARERHRLRVALRGPKVPVTECVHGHPYDEANTYVDARGRRSCRTCRHMHSANHRKRSAQESQ